MDRLRDLGAIVDFFEVLLKSDIVWKFSVLVLRKAMRLRLVFVWLKMFSSLNDRI